VVTVTNARPGPVAVQILREGMASRPLLCPFDLQMWVVDRMLNFEIVDDPLYEGLELQVFDDPAQGTGMIVLLKRRQDGRFDIYRQPGLTLDPELAKVGGELGAWVEADIDPARFDTSHDGVVNRAHDGPIGTASTKALGAVEIAPGVLGIASLRAGRGGHTAHLRLEPALPDLTSLASGVSAKGAWRLGVDDDPATVGAPGPPGDPVSASSWCSMSPEAGGPRGCRCSWRP
jgi:hypothetical protein